jgi:hypothetical protein
MPKKSADHKANKKSRSMQRRERKSGRGEKPGKGGDARKMNPGKSMAEGGKSKDGCFPKLFMFLLPFLAAGTYFFLRA